ncbi:MAG: DnaJ domain-containing protein [Pseudomonadota bacterium]
MISIDSHMMVPLLITLLVFYGVGRFLNLFALGIVGRVSILAVVCIIMQHFIEVGFHQRTLGLLCIGVFILGSFWKDWRRLLRISVLWVQYTFNWGPYAHDEHEDNADYDNDEDPWGEDERGYNENAYNAHGSYEDAIRRAEQAERYYQQKTRQADALAQQAFMDEEHSRTLDPNVLADAFEILGVDHDADIDGCRQAYKRLCSIYHPDKISQFKGWRREQAEHDMKQINLAWANISSSH